MIPKTQFNFEEALFLSRFIKDLEPSLDDKYYDNVYDRFTAIFEKLKEYNIPVYLNEIIHENKKLSVVLDCSGYFWSFHGHNGVEDTLNLFNISTSSNFILKEVGVMKNSNQKTKAMINLNEPETFDKETFVNIQFNFKNDGKSGFSSNTSRVYYQFGGDFEKSFHQEPNIEAKLNSFLEPVENRDLKLEYLTYSDISNLEEKSCLLLFGKDSLEELGWFFENNNKTHEFIIQSYNLESTPDGAGVYPNKYYKLSLNLETVEKQKKFIDFYKKHLSTKDDLFFTSDTPYSQKKLNELRYLENHSISINSNWVSLDYFLDIAYIEKWAKEIEIEKNLKPITKIKSPQRRF